MISNVDLLTEFKFFLISEIMNCYPTSVIWFNSQNAATSNSISSSSNICRKLGTSSVYNVTTANKFDVIIIYMILFIYIFLSIKLNPFSLILYIFWSI